MRTQIMLGTLLVAVTARSAAANGFLDGNTLLKQCEGSLSEKAVCDGYLQGVSDTLDFIATAIPSSGLKNHCVPVGTKPEVMRGIIIRMLRLPGGHNEVSASAIAMTAFSAAWRCNANGKYHEADEILGRAIRPK
jgi:hypothetical protein